MSNFCSNCGGRLETVDQFCHSCGTQVQSQKSQVQPIQSQSHYGSGIEIESEISQLLNIKSVIGKWSGGESDSAESTMHKRKGFLLLTKDEFIFVAKVGLFSKKFKSIWRVPLSSIKSVKKMGWPLKAVFIAYIKAPEGAGTFRKFMGQRSLAFKIEEEKSFIAKIKKLNPRIQ